MDSEILFYLSLMGVSFVLFCVWVLEVVLISLRGKLVLVRWMKGLTVSFVVFLVSLPSVIVGVMGAMEKGEPINALVIGVVVGVLVLLLMMVWWMFLYGGGAVYWKESYEGGYVILDRKMLLGRGRCGAWGKVFLSLGIGLIYGLLSCWVFEKIGVNVNENMLGNVVLEGQGGEEGAGWLIALVLFSTFTSAALVEEMSFRGMLLPWFARVLGWKEGKGLGFVLSTLLVSLLWAVIHWPNTNMPVVKVVQIFLIGLVFCVFARKWGMESAIAGHVGLNWSAVLLVCLGYN